MLKAGFELGTSSYKIETTLPCLPKLVSVSHLKMKYVFYLLFLFLRLLFIFCEQGTVKID